MDKMKVKSFENNKKIKITLFKRIIAILLFLLVKFFNISCLTVKIERNNKHTIKHTIITAKKV